MRSHKDEVEYHRNRLEVYESMIKKMTRLLGITLVLWTANLRGVMIAPFPGLDKLIHEADAIVILRVEKQLTDLWSPTLYTTYQCYIYQTLKGDIPAGKRIRLQLMDARISFVTPYTPFSTHLVFLTRKRTPDEPTDYRSLEIQGANVRISPFGNEKLPPEQSIKEKIQTLLTRASEYNKKEYEKEQAHLNRMRTITVSDPSDNLTLEQMERLVANAVNAIITDIESPPEYSVPGLADKLKTPDYAHATRLINILFQPTTSDNAKPLDVLEKAKKKIKAEKELIAMGKKAVPALIDNLNRKLPQTKGTADTPHAERPVLMIISNILDPVEATYRTRRTGAGKSVSAVTYFLVHFETQEQAHAWWDKHKTDSLEKIHRLVLDWYIDRKNKLGFENTEPIQQILEELKFKYKE